MSGYLLKNKSYQYTINVNGAIEDYTFNAHSSLPSYIDIIQNNTFPNIFNVNVNEFPDSQDGTLITLTFSAIKSGITDVEVIEKILLSSQEISLIQPPTIFGPNKKMYNSTLNLMADTVSLFDELGIYISAYRWILPDESSIENKSISYEIPNDINLIGTTLTFKCKAIDSLDNESDWTIFEVLIDNDDNPNVVYSEYT